MLRIRFQLELLIIKDQLSFLYKVKLQKDKHFHTHFVESQTQTFFPPSIFLLSLDL